MNNFIEITKGQHNFLVRVVHKEDAFYLEAIEGKPWHQFGDWFDHTSPKRTLLERGTNAIQTYRDLTDEYLKEGHEKVQSLISAFDEKRGRSN